MENNTVSIWRMNINFIIYFIRMIVALIMWIYTNFVNPIRWHLRGKSTHGTGSTSDLAEGVQNLSRGSAPPQFHPFSCKKYFGSCGSHWWERTIKLVAKLFIL